MASKTKNVKLGVCKISFGGVDLGYTKGGAEVEVTTETHKVLVDQFGESIVNEYVIKRDIMVKTALAETTLDNLSLIMPGSSIVVDVNDPTKRRADVKSGIGTNLKSIAKELRLHPIEIKDEADDSEDLVIPICSTSGAMKFSYKHDSERVFDTEFKGYPDPTTKTLFLIGSLSIGASATEILTDANGEVITDADGDPITVLA